MTERNAPSRRNNFDQSSHSGSSVRGETEKATEGEDELRCLKLSHVPAIQFTSSLVMGLASGPILTPTPKPSYGLLYEACEVNTVLIVNQYA